MPKRPKSICRYPSCHTLIAMPGYCQTHAKESVGWNRTSKASSADRGYGHAWRESRDRVMRRDCGLCQPCYKHGRITAASEVDHIVNKASGGTDDDSNLQAICAQCHKDKTSRESQEAREKR